MKKHFAILLFALLAVAAFAPRASAQASVKGVVKDAEGKPIAMPANLVGLEVRLGLKDTEPSPWGGSVELSEGKLLSMSVRRGGA